jgi:hypothetical protein
MEQLRLFEREGGVRVTVRDEAALRWLVEQRAASLSTIAELLRRLEGGPSISDRRARHIVSRWEQMGLAKRSSIWHGEPPVVCPTAKAARMHGVERFRRPAVGVMRHTIAVADVRLRIERPGAGRIWIPESHLRRVCPPGEHLADGGWMDEHGATAVEVELTLHGSKRVEAAIRSLLAASIEGRPRWNSVMYLCAPPTLSQVQGVVRALEAPLQRQVTVRPLP